MIRTNFDRAHHDRPVAKEDTAEYLVYYHAYVLAHNTFENNEGARRHAIEGIGNALQVLKED